MSFQYSVIGDNSPENREHLEKLGYENALDGVVGDFIISFNLKRGSFYICVKQVGIPESHVVSCIGNPALFRAVTAMREDNDYLQWFETDFENKLIPDVKEMYLCKSREFCGITVKYKGEDFVIGSAGFHKATLAELQEHFK